MPIVGMWPCGCDHPSCPVGVLTVHFESVGWVFLFGFGLVPNGTPGSLPAVAVVGTTMVSLRDG